MLITDAVAVVERSPVEVTGSGARRWPFVVVGVVGSIVSIGALYSVAGLQGNVRLFTAGIAAAVAAVGFWLGAARQWPHVDLGFRVSALWLSVLTLAAVLAGFLPLAESRDPSKTLSTPTLLRPDLFSAHPLGTDRLGLDLLGGVLYGARVSLVVGVGAATVGLLVGLPVGMVAGFLRGKVEVVTDFVTNVMLSFPPIILLLAMVSVTKPSVTNVAIVLGLISAPVYIRIAKLNTVMYAERDFIPAAILSGATKRRILVKELLPCVLPPVMTYGVLVIALAIVAESSLSFLGLSIQRPEPTWGNMIAAGRDSYTTNPHLVFVAGAVLVVTVLSLNRINQALRRRSDSPGAPL